MKIARDNYEIFFLDYLEGKLKESQIDEFLDFLEQNQDLKDELHQFESVRLPEEHILFSEKETLYKSLSDQTISSDNKLIAYLEGDLNEDDRVAFENYLASHTGLQKDYRLFEKTRLVPESEIRMPNKHKLYRKHASVVVMNWAVRVAAVVVLFWGINKLYQDGNLTETLKTDHQVAVVTPKTIIPEKKMEPMELVQEKIKPVKESKSTISKPFHKQPKISIEETQPPFSSKEDRTLSAIAAITPKTMQLEAEPFENHLAVSGSALPANLKEHRKVLTVEEFLADRAKKVGNESLLSAERIARLGLGVASEISGRRIGYTQKNGKITSLEFESRLMAFSIPLRKK